MEFDNVPDEFGDILAGDGDVTRDGSVPPNGSGGGKSVTQVHPRMADRQMQATLGRHLRVMFDDVARSPVPDKFLLLLQTLESKEKEQSE